MKTLELLTGEDYNKFFAKGVPISATVKIPKSLGLTLEDLAGFVSNPVNDPFWWQGVKKTQKTNDIGPEGATFYQQSKINRVPIILKTNIEIVKYKKEEGKVLLTMVSYDIPLPFIATYIFSESVDHISYTMDAKVLYKFPLNLLNVITFGVVDRFLRRQTEFNFADRLGAFVQNPRYIELIRDLSANPRVVMTLEEANGIMEKIMADVKDTA